MRFKAPVWVRSVAGIVAIAVIIFMSSGHLGYWQGWVFLGINMAIVALTTWFLRNDPELNLERLNPGRGIMWWDKGYFLLSTPLYFAAVILAGIDAGRRHWSPRPAAALYIVFLAVYIVGQGLFLWAKTINPFFSSVARIQTDRGQTVCREGPYRFCRHPGYLGGLLFGLATPLVLGSYWALFPQALAALLLIGRTLLEDRMLREDLLWYTEYTKAVPFRLVPGVW
jgi:protein-S-isoprenylcysteine O-methyltransferase Ste14